MFVPKTIEDNRLPWLRQGSFLKKYNMVQRVALATTGFLSLEEYNMLQKITMATTGFLSFTTPYLESSKGCGTRGHLTLGLVAIYSKVKGKLVLCVLGKFDRVPEPLEPGLNPPLGNIHTIEPYPTLPFKGEAHIHLYIHATLIPTLKWGQWTQNQAVLC